MKKIEKYIVRVKDSYTGKWKTKSVNSLKLAKELEAKFKLGFVEGNFFEGRNGGDVDFYRYLEYAKVHKKTWWTDQRRWEIHVQGRDFLTQQGVSKIMSTMKDDGFAPATIDHVFKVIRRVVNWHIQNGYYHKPNPCNTIKPPKYDNRITNYLSKDQVHELMTYLRNWSNERASRVILFALFTGRRKSEILNLKWKDIDFTEKTITCRDTKNGRSLSFPVNSNAFEIIEKAFNDRISEFVFPSAAGTYYYLAFSTSWRKLKKKLSLPYRFHDLRHTYASYLASSGKVDIYTLKTLLGHQDISLTMRYAHLSDQAVRKATCVLDEIY